jgi:DDE superfamily endonuclease
VLWIDGCDSHHDEKMFAPPEADIHWPQVVSYCSYVQSNRQSPPPYFVDNKRSPKKMERQNKEGKFLDDVEFNLFERDSDGNVVSVKYQGAWLMVDNGYLSWPITVPPFKNTGSRKEIRWSEWLESMRKKDVECTFGILKGRWRILKSGIRVHGVDATDNIWKTCCALHHMLLEVDGLDEKLEDGFRSDWDGELGQHSVDDVCGVPFAIQGLGDLRHYDSSGMGRRDDVADDSSVILTAQQQPGRRSTTVADTRENTVRVARNLSLDFFRSRLVEHFDILFQRNEIQWPVRSGEERTNDLDYTSSHFITTGTLFHYYLFTY